MITAQVERFEDCLPELRHIFPRHWQELALFQDRMLLDPQYDEYVARERAGRLLLVTVRKDGKIAAYYTAQIAPGFHYVSTLTGTMDMLYIVPEERGRGLVMPLFKQVEKALRRRGVRLWYSGFKTAMPLELDQLLPMMGFQPADSYMAKWLGDTP